MASELRARADRYVEAVETHGWDGEWYRRAYYDDGTPLGSAESDECRIDSIAQSWSVISGAGDPARQTHAMRSLERHLVREDVGILLLTPPFDRTAHDPGYIKGYLPGVRENGAQYTHAALWAVLATAMMGDGDRALELFQLLNPLERTRTPASVEVYRTEPYVVAADVYSAEGQVGTRRVDLVHGLGELDVPRGAGGDPRFHQAGRPLPGGPTGAGVVAGVQPRVPVRKRGLRGGGRATPRGARRSAGGGARRTDARR